MSGYNPFTYNPRVASFFGDSHALPESAAALSQQRPDLSQHLVSVWSFVGWLKDTNPSLYNAITNYRPDLLDPATVVTSGSLSPTTKMKTLRGMGDVPDPTAAQDTAPVATSDFSSTLTAWGNDLVGTIQSVAPAYFQAKSQSDLMNINIQRAAQGLPPIDSATLAPTVNFGLSKDVQTLGMVAIGGLVLVGLLAAFRKGK